MALTLTNADILGKLPALSDFKGKAKDGSTTTLISKALIGENEDLIEDAYICFLSGSNRGVDKIIINFDSTTGTCTFSEVSSSIDNTVQFSITLSGFSTFIEQSSEVIEDDFRNTGLDLDLFLTTSQLKQLHLYLTISNICLSRSENADTDDIYYQYYLRYKELYEKEFADLSADYDADEDGSIDESEENTQTSQIGFTR